MLPLNWKEASFSDRSSSAIRLPQQPIGRQQPACRWLPSILTPIRGGPLPPPPPAVSPSVVTMHRSLRAFRRLGRCAGLLASPPFPGTAADNAARWTPLRVAMVSTGPGRGRRDLYRDSRPLCGSAPSALRRLRCLGAPGRAFSRGGVRVAPGAVLRSARCSLPAARGLRRPGARAALPSCYLWCP